MKICPHCGRKVTAGYSRHCKSPTCPWVRCGCKAIVDLTPYKSGHVLTIPPEAAA